MGIQYQYMIPPFFKPYEKMTVREAEQYFEYYVSQIPIRIEYLQNFLDKNVDKKSDWILRKIRWLSFGIGMATCLSNSKRQIIKKIRPCIFPMVYWGWVRILPCTLARCSFKRTLQSDGGILKNPKIIFSSRDLLSWDFSIIYAIALSIQSAC